RPRLRKLAFRDALEHGERLTPREAADIVEGSATRPTYCDLYAAIANDGPPTDFDAIACPTTIVWGAKDRILPLKSYSERIRRLVPPAEFIVLADGRASRLGALQE